MARKNLGKKLGFRSGLEMDIAKQLQKAGVAADYEQWQLRYIVPEKEHKYTPDFVLPNGIIIETKGRFMLGDRQKHLLIRAQNPKLDIRFIFTNSKSKLYKGAKSTYADWCNKHGFMYADKIIPKEWLR
jgi:hypothetical protein